MIVDPEFKDLIIPLAEDEHKQLEENIVAEGCRNALVVWKEEGILLDGHHRLNICKAHHLKYDVKEISLPDRNEAKIWILKNQKGRRNLNTSQIALLALDLEAVLSEQARDRQRQAGRDFGENHPKKSLRPSGPQALKRNPQARDEAGKAFGVSGAAVKRAKIVKDRGVPELLDKVRSGEVTGRAASTVSRLPKEDQERVVKEDIPTIKRVSTAVPIVEKIKETSPNVAKKVLDKVIHGEAKNASEALDQVDDDEKHELWEFIESDKKMDAEAAKNSKILNRRLHAAHGGCLMPNVAELWCNDCEWGFDVYLPVPVEASCPYCNGNNLTKRDVSWYPGIKEDEIHGA